MAKLSYRMDYINSILSAADGRNFDEICKEVKIRPFMLTNYIAHLENKNLLRKDGTGRYTVSQEVHDVMGF